MELAVGGKEMCVLLLYEHVEVVLAGDSFDAKQAARDTIISKRQCQAAEEGDRRAGLRKCCEVKIW